MGLFNDLFGEDQKKRGEAFGLFSFLEQEQNNDEDLDNLGLEKWQQEEVRKGNYDSSNFEEEDLEDDDYYSDDV